MKLVAFDLDDTLAPSKSALPEQVDAALTRLLQKTDVLVISGGTIDQFRAQLLSNLHANEEQLLRLHLMPTCGTRYYLRSKENWDLQYSHDLDVEQKQRIMEALETTSRELGFWVNDPAGEIIEDRGSQITYSALGQQARLEDKRAWDPTGEKKAALRDAVAPLIPDLEVRSGGSTSVDVTLKGVDKAYGMQKIMEQTGYAKDEIVFIGDRLDPDGNDYPVKAAGFETISVSGWEETPRVIDDLINTRLS
ncbi:MAG: HAD-IIB family hydrolase [Actinomycetaceae bacterium]|nr:HAD-IIB family hydrolase [Actinomycetaceae bacterium]